MCVNWDDKGISIIATIYMFRNKCQNVKKSRKMHRFRNYISFILFYHVLNYRFIILLKNEEKLNKTFKSNEILPNNQTFVLIHLRSLTKVFFGFNCSFNLSSNIAQDADNQRSSISKLCVVLKLVRIVHISRASSHPKRHFNRYNWRWNIPKHDETNEESGDFNRHRPPWNLSTRSVRELASFETEIASRVQSRLEQNDQRKMKSARAAMTIKFTGYFKQSKWRLPIFQKTKVICNEVVCTDSLTK